MEWKHRVEVIRMELKDSETLTVKSGLMGEWSHCVKVNSKDAYSHGCIEAATAIGRMLDAGKSPEEAKTAMKGLGLTGFMAGIAAQMVSYFHPRGDEFRKWWNLELQIGTEGEEANEEGTILNPAVLNVKEIEGGVPVTFKIQETKK